MSSRKARMASEGTERLYKDAIRILDSRRRPQRPIEAAHHVSSNKSGTPGLKGQPAIAGMERWLEITGYKMVDIDKLNIIHVAGTKGKGSTCAWIESFLRMSGATFGKCPITTGLYTSPHLIHPEERIRINFDPISKDKFAEYFFQVWNQLSNSGENLPRYLQLLLLTALHAFKQEGVNATIIETHHGGEFDSTNVIKRPVVTVVTPLGMDHIEQLGPTIDKIAWHKAGIFKNGCRALCSQQYDEAAVRVLRKRALDKGVELQVVDADDSELPRDAPQLSPRVQRANCSLGLAAARAFLTEMAPVGPNETKHVLPIEETVAQFDWPGRFQTIRVRNMTWYLDSAHNDMSITQAADWFMEMTRTTTAVDQDAQRNKRVVMFGQESNHRDPAAVLKSLTSRLSVNEFDIDYALCIVPQSKLDFNNRNHGVSNDTHSEVASHHEMTISGGTYIELWHQCHPQIDICFENSVEDALDMAETLAIEAHGELEILVTGSQRLIGAALSFLNDKNV